MASNDWVLFVLESSTITLKTLDNATNDEQTLKKLMAGRIDIWATGISAGPWIAKKFGAKSKPLLPLRATDLHLACNPGVPSATIPTLNQTLKAVVKDGTTARIFQQYQ